jgi:hypothetical protein
MVLTQGAPVLVQQSSVAYGGGAQHIPVDWLLALGAVMAVGGLFTLRSWWANGRRVGSTDPTRALNRSYLANYLAFSALVFGGLSVSASNHHLVSEEILRPVTVVLLGAFGVFFLCSVSIILLNRPRFLVPPKARSAKGILQR